MRDEAHVDATLGAIRAEWLRRPELRLTQLIYDLVASARRPDSTPPCPELFYLDDEQLLAYLGGDSAPAE